MDDYQLSGNSREFETEDTWSSNKNVQGSCTEEPNSTTNHNIENSTPENVMLT